MSFHFRRLQLKDWLVYGGVTDIELPQFDQGRNIVVIHGQNGFGKTSLLRALEFLFHNRYNREELISLWHEQARETCEGSMEVALEFNYNGRLFKLIRKIEFKPWGNTTAVVPSLQLVDVENEEIEEDQVEDKIELIIPKKSQQFSFFDGAEITRYAQRQHEEGVKEAIEQMLGIPAVRNLKKDLERLISGLEREQQEFLTIKGQSQDTVAMLEQLKNDKSACEERRASFVEKLNGVQAASEELEKEAAEIVAIQAQRAQLADKQARRADYEERRQEIDKQIKDFLSQAPLYMLKVPLTQIVQEELAKQDTPRPRESYAQRKRLLESLIDGELCLCGRPIDMAAEQHITQELERLETLTAHATGSVKRRVTTLEISGLSALLDRLQTHEIDGLDLFGKRATIDDRIEEIESDIRKLRAELEGHELIEVQELFEQQKALSDQENELKNQVEGLNNSLQRIRGKIDENQRKLNELTAGTEEGRGLSMTLTATRQLYEAVEEFVERLVTEKRKDIEHLASKIFTSITNKPIEYAGVRVKDDYTLEVYRHDESIVENKDLSAGEKEVLSYSFITALNLASPNPAPFVMDTPFGHLDSGHRDGLLKSLPSLQVQVFLLATDRDLPEQERGKVERFFAKEFEIKRDQQNARSYIEEG